MFFTNDSDTSPLLLISNRMLVIISVTFLKSFLLNPLDVHAHVSNLKQEVVLVDNRSFRIMVFFVRHKVTSVQHKRSLCLLVIPRFFKSIMIKWLSVPFKTMSIFLILNLLINIFGIINYWSNSCFVIIFCCTS